MNSDDKHAVRAALARAAMAGGCTREQAASVVAEFLFALPNAEAWTPVERHCAGRQTLQCETHELAALVRDLAPAAPEQPRDG